MLAARPEITARDHHTCSLRRATARDVHREDHILPIFGGPHDGGWRFRVRRGSRDDEETQCDELRNE